MCCNNINSIVILAPFSVSVLFVFCLERACSIFGVSVFNVCEVGFDSPTKLVSGGPRFMVDPTLRHCTFSHGLD